MDEKKAGDNKPWWVFGEGLIRGWQKLSKREWRNKACYRVSLAGPS